MKHALVAGRADFVANTAKVFNVVKTTAPTGALTEADLIAAAPTASVSYGSYGTVSLAPLLGTSARVLTEHAGPQYAAFQYVAAFPSDSSVRAVFYVQLWAGGRYRVRVAVENGTAPVNGAAKSGVATVTIAGAQRFSGSVSMPQGCRWDVVGFNGTDPVITPQHDTAYLRATRLVPNYGWTNVAGSLLSSLSRNYTPMATMGWPQDMGQTGAGDYIGILSQWDACYACSGDARAYGSVIDHARGMGIYSIFYRNPSTQRLARMSEFPTTYVASSWMTGGGSNTYMWESAHHPGAGYLAWLITAERFFLEVMQANAWAAFCTNSGNTATRSFASQVRAKSWRFRTIAQNAAVGPDGDGFRADAKALFVANVAYFYNNNASSATPGTGLMFTAGADPFDNEPAPGVQKSMFEYLFGVAALGFAWDIEMGLSAAERSQFQALRDYFYRVPVGLTGRGPANGEFLWRRAPGPYRMTIGTGGTESNPILYNTWGEVYNATYTDGLATGNTLLEAYVDDPTDYAFAYGNWGHVLTALAYAVDHQKPGALEGWNRLSGATNWKSNTDKYVNAPNYGVKPRSVP